jgi:hypothetical protein
MHSLTSVLDGGEWSASRPGRFTPRERAADTPWIGGWVGPRVVLDAAVKRKIPSPRRESNPRTRSSTKMNLITLKLNLCIVGRISLVIMHPLYELCCRP